MSDILERRYRYLLRTYPPAHRARRHDEILTTLMEAARPGQRFPAAREAASLFLSGLRARLGPADRADSRSLWLDGLRIGALLLLVGLTSKTAWAAFDSNGVGPKAGTGSPGCLPSPC